MRTHEDTFDIRRQAWPSWWNLGAVLDDLLAAGRTTPCLADPGPFTSGQRADRAEAAESCRWCPALSACGAFADANRERAHVWAGRDRGSAAG